MSSDTAEPSITRTLRIKEESDNILQREADRAGTSVNALMSSLIDRYVGTLRFFKSGEMLSISGISLAALLNYISEDEIAGEAYAQSTTLVREGLMQLGMNLNYENVLWYIRQVLGQYYGWYRCDLFGEDLSDTLHLSHGHGYKWSVFVANYITSILNEVIDFQTNMVISAQSVNIQILKKT